MFCRTCQNQVHPQAIACPNCGVPPLVGRSFCHQCGINTIPEQVMCTQCGISLARPNPFNINVGESPKLIVFLLAFFLGGIGAHKFYLGYQKQGIIHVLCVFPGMFLFGLPTLAIGIIAFVESIIYISKSDEEFKRTYIDNVRPWF